MGTSGHCSRAIDTGERWSQANEAHSKIIGVSKSGSLCSNLKSATNKLCAHL